jgi:hypothetical protein
MSRKDKAARAKAEAIGKTALEAWESERRVRKMYRHLDIMHYLTLFMLAVAMVLVVIGFLMGKDMTPAMIIPV